MSTLWTLVLLTPAALSQVFAPPDRDNPGDEMIQTHLSQLATRLDAKFADDCQSLADWERERPRYREEYLYMLGLWPLPEKTPLMATVTGEVKGDGYVVESLHYQSKPKLYCTANVYRPATIEPGAKLPAVLYVCGHSGMGRNGNKTAFQSHGIWLARHGYVCLMVDTLQLGEIAAIHHGTYRENRWWWHSRGYTPAGVECWNGVRGIDYLVSRPDVDAERIAVTGISGGGAATFWVAAADERVKVAVPVSGMADLESYVGNRVINGHCDCMFLYNTFEWPWTRIAGLIAPRPMLFTNSDNDRIFPMDANQRISNRLERLYSLYGAGDRFDTLVSVGGHDYRADLRQGIFRFLNTHLKNAPALVTDAEVDLETRVGRETKTPIPPEQLRAFATDADLPRDQLNTTIDESFVPLGDPGLPRSKEDYPAWRDKLHRELRRVSFRPLPERMSAATPLKVFDARRDLLATEDRVLATWEPLPSAAGKPDRAIVRCVSADISGQEAMKLRSQFGESDAVYILQPRGCGEFKWTQKNPPNYVMRSHVLLGRTVDLGKVWDLLALVQSLRESNEKRGWSTPIWVAGEGPDALLAAYAALWSDDIAGVIAVNPPASHHAPDAPQFLNILRVADVPVILGSLAPKPLTLIDAKGDVRPTVEKIYKVAGAELK
jgi:dienelactone hydrolase